MFQPSRPSSSMAMALSSDSQQLSALLRSTRKSRPQVPPRARRHPGSRRSLPCSMRLMASAGLGVAAQVIAISSSQTPMASTDTSAPGPRPPSEPSMACWL